MTSASGNVDAKVKNEKAQLLCHNLSKPFDRVCHKKLLEKINFYGSTRKSSKPYTIKLDNRKQIYLVPQKLNPWSPTRFSLKIFTLYPGFATSE